MTVFSDGPPMPDTVRIVFHAFRDLPRAERAKQPRKTRMHLENDLAEQEDPRKNEWSVFGGTRFWPEGSEWDALEQAQRFCREALEFPSLSKDRAAMARKAVATCSDCADGLVLLAEETCETIEVALEMFEKAMQAGRAALERESETFFKDYHERFWEVLRTRPYCRALAGYANCLYKLGKYSEASKAFRNLLLLNKEDNTGSRHIVASILLHYGNFKSIEGLFEEYPPQDCHWYTFSLMKMYNNQPFANALQKGLESNIYVALFLLREAHFPTEDIPLPNTIHIGLLTEAVYYTKLYARHWSSETLNNLRSCYNAYLVSKRWTSDSISHHCLRTAMLASCGKNLRRMVADTDFILPTYVNGVDDEPTSVVQKITELIICGNPGCATEATFRCGRCKKMMYCSRQCQKKDWKNGHKSTCQP